MNDQLWDRTWNPTIGGEPIPDGCHGQAVKTARWLQGRGIAGYEGVTQKHGDGSVNWTGQVNMLESRLMDPFRWRKPRRIFVDSMSDLFHETVTDVFLDKVFTVMALSQRHTYQILTKRPERMRAYLNTPDRAHRIGRYMSLGTIMTTPGTLDANGVEMASWFKDGVPWPLPNVWGGTSTENQDEANRRIPLLLDANLAVRWISAEPLLSGLVLNEFHLAGDEEYWDFLRGRRGPTPQHYALPPTGTAKLDWVVVGGLSGGPKDQLLVERRPPGIGETDPEPIRYGYLPGVGRVQLASNVKVDHGDRWMPTERGLRWVRFLRNQCVEAKTPFFFKQFGGPTPHAGGDVLDGVQWHEFPDGKGGTAA